MAASGLARARSADIHVIEPRARGGATGIEVVDGEPKEPDASQISLTVDDDGGVTIEVGSDARDAPTPSKGFSENLAERIDEGALQHLAEHLLEGIEADRQSRKEWEDTANIAARYLGIKLEEPSEASADGTISKQVATCLLEAVVKSWSTARAELLPVGGPVKVKRDDLPTGETPSMGHNGGPPMAPDPSAPPDPNAQPEIKPDDLANALEQDLNWYLTNGDREYYPDFSKMLFSRALIGNAFRKVFRCPIRRRPVSVWVKAQNLIISNDCAHISGAGRVTEIIRTRQSTMRRMQAAGHYRPIDLVLPTGETTDTEKADAEIEGIAAAPTLPADFEHMVYECLCELDSHVIAGLEALDQDETGKRPGYPMPYRVSIDYDTRAVLEIRRDWKQGDDEHRRLRRYVKYGFVPSTGFYDLGLIHMAGNPTLAATMLERATVDSALFSNFPGGVYLQGPTTREKSTVIRPSPGEFIGLNSGETNDINKAIMPLPYKPPSPEAIALGERMVQKVRDLAGIISLPVGEGRMGNTPVGTIMSYVEAVAQVPGAVHKDDHVAQAEEFELLRMLFAEEPEALWRGNKSPARKWRVAEELMSPDLVPAADPNTPSAVHRLMKLQAMITISGMPQFQGIADNRAIYAQAVRLLGTGDPGEFTMPPQQAAPPQPDPRIVAAQIKAQSEGDKVQADMAKDQLDHQQKMAELQQEGQQRDSDRDSAETRAAMSLEATRLKTAHDTANAGADRVQDAGIAGAQLVQKHAQHLNEFGLAAAGQAQQAAQPQQPPAQDSGP